MSFCGRIFLMVRCLVFILYPAGTKPPEDSEKFYNPGFNPPQAMALFETQRELIRREFISRAVNLPPEIQEVIFYARTPDIDLPEVLQAILAKRVAKDIRDGKVGGPAGTPLVAELGFNLESLWKKKRRKRGLTKSVALSSVLMLSQVSRSQPPDARDRAEYQNAPGVIVLSAYLLP